jgi:ribonuclease HI
MKRDFNDPSLPGKLIRIIDALRSGGDVERAARDADLDPEVAQKFLDSIKDDLVNNLSASKPPGGKSSGGNVDRLVVFSDGASRGNPGQAACGVIVTDENGQELLRRSKRLGVVTNNVAEYEGVLLALELAQTLGAADVLLKLDSELVVRQLNGLYKVKHPSLKPLFEKAKARMDEFKHIDVVHVPRAEMKEADKLANDELDGKR